MFKIFKVVVQHGATCIYISSEIPVIYFHLVSLYNMNGVLLIYMYIFYMNKLYTEKQSKKLHKSAAT